MGCISYLNSVANFRRKGRDDLPADVLFNAVRTIQRCDLAEKRLGRAGAGLGAPGTARARSSRPRRARSAGTSWSRWVEKGRGGRARSFVAMRVYLREIGKCATAGIAASKA